MNPEEYYKNKLETVCENKINEISDNRINKYWEIVKEATEQTFPSCEVVSTQKKYESLEDIQCSYNKSQFIKSKNIVCHYLNIGEHPIELQDDFIYYPEISPEENEITVFEASYIKEQMRELESNVLRQASSYQKNVEKILGLKTELSKNFKKERIPFIYQMLQSDFVKTSEKKNNSITANESDGCENEDDVIESKESPETSAESYENIDEYGEDCDEEDDVDFSENNADDYEDGGVVEPIFCDFGTSQYSDFNIEEPDFEEEFDYGEPNIDIAKEEMENLSFVDTDTIDGVDAESGIVGNDDGIVDYGFTQRINNHRREFNQMKNSRYGKLYAGQR